MAGVLKDFAKDVILIYKNSLSLYIFALILNLKLKNQLILQKHLKED